MGISPPYRPGVPLGKTAIVFGDSFCREGYGSLSVGTIHEKCIPARDEINPLVWAIVATVDFRYE